MSLLTKESAIRGALVFMGVFTMQPGLSLINPGQLASYGVVDPDIVVQNLLQHRGLLQMALGAALVYAAFKPDIRVAAALAAIFTKGGGLLLTFSQPDPFANGIRIAMVFDPLCIALLLAILVDVALVRRRSMVAAGQA